MNPTLRKGLADISEKAKTLAAEMRAFNEEHGAHGASTLYQGQAVTVTFEDHGQRFIEWDIEHGRVVAVRPFDGSSWVGLEIHSTPTPGERLRTNSNRGTLMIKYPLTKVVPMAAAQTNEVSDEILNSKVVTRGAQALLAAYKSQAAPNSRAALRESVNYRKVVPPKPEILPACKNCKHFGYDSDDRMNLKGEITCKKINLRCHLHAFPVINNGVCDRHEFHRADRSDK